MKKICLLLAVVMTLTLLAGCGKQGGSVTVSVVTAYGEGDGNRDNYVTAYKAYEEATGNVIADSSAVSNEEWKQQVLTSFEKGEEPDVLFFFTGADADDLIRGGKVVPISEIRAKYPEYGDNMKDSMIPVSTADGRQYAIPVNGYWEGLYVNKNVLAACGIDVPGADYTWEQFLLDCQVIKDEGYTPIACSLAEVPHYWFEFCTFNYGSIVNHATLPQSSGDSIGQIWSEGLGDIKQLYDMGFLPEQTLTMPDAESCRLMLEDKAAFLLDGSWKLGWFQTNADNLEDFTVTYVPAKGERGATDIVGGLSMGYYITRKAWDDDKKREACVEFVKAMTTDEVVNTFGTMSVTALKNGTTPPSDADSLVMDALAMTKGCTGIVLAVQDSLSIPARESLFADVPRVVTGELTPEQAIDDCLAIKSGQ